MKIIPMSFAINLCIIGVFVGAVVLFVSVICRMDASAQVVDLTRHGPKAYSITRTPLRGGPGNFHCDSGSVLG